MYIRCLGSEGDSEKMDPFDACSARRPKLSFKPCWEEAAQTCNNRLCLSPRLFTSSPHGRNVIIPGTGAPRALPASCAIPRVRGAACLCPQGCPSGPFPASTVAPDLFNFDAEIVAGHCWPGKEGGPGRQLHQREGLAALRGGSCLCCSGGSGSTQGESVLVKKTLCTKEEGSGPLCFLRGKIPADVILLDDLKCL